MKKPAISPIPFSIIRVVFVLLVLPSCQVLDRLGISVIPEQYSLGGSINGLEGHQLVLGLHKGTAAPAAADKPEQQLVLVENGSFVFSSKLSSGSGYYIRPESAPQGPTQACSVIGGQSGIIKKTSLQRIQVDCEVNNYSISGVVEGLKGEGLELTLNASSSLTVSQNGFFNFSDVLEDGSPFGVVVTRQPINPVQLCSASRNSGTLFGRIYDQVQINCSDQGYIVAGFVVGLQGSGLQLSLNEDEVLSVERQGFFRFSRHVADSSSVNVQVKTHPTGPDQVCSIYNNPDQIRSTPKIDLVLTCNVVHYPVSGFVSGLEGQGLVLEINGGDQQLVTSNGAFRFSSDQADGSAYNVRVWQQPSSPSQKCSVNNSTGVVNGEEVDNISVNCSTSQYAVGGYVSGYSGSGLVLVNNNGDSLEITKDGFFQFKEPLTDGAEYSVTVQRQPVTPSQFCSVLSATGSVTADDVENIFVNCIDSYTISGSVSGLAGDGLVLENSSNADLLLIDKTAGSETSPLAFTFEKGIDPGGSYQLGIKARPTGLSQTCSFDTPADASGSGMSADITGINITCSTDSFSVGGTVNGLASGSLGLRLNGGETISVSGGSDSTSFTFSSSLLDGSAYSVTVSGPAAGYLCQVSGSGGNLAGSDISSAVVNCSTDTAPPYVVSVSSSDTAGIYNDGDMVTIQLTINKPVVVDDQGLTAPTLLLNSGGTAAYSGGSGTNVLTFTYTVGVGNDAALLDVGSSGALLANDATLLDTDGNALDLQLPEVNAGNQLAEAGLVVDAFAAPLSTLNLAAADDTGISDSDNITSDNSLALSGQAEAGASIQIVDTLNSNNILATTTADGSGNWSVNVTLNSGDKDYGLAGRQTDIYGYTSQPSTPLVVTLDRTVATPAVPDLAAASDSGDSDSDNLTRVTTGLVITGTAEADSTVELLSGGFVISSAVADGSGNYSYSVDLSHGFTYNLVTRATDVAGNVSVLSPTLDITVDNLAPVPTLVNLASGNANANLAVPGVDTITLTLNLPEAVSQPTVTILGAGAGVVEAGPASGYTANYAVPGGTANQAVLFTVSSAFDVYGNEVSLAETTDGSFVNVSTSTQPSVVSTETVDSNGNGHIDHYKVTFDQPMDDSTFDGYISDSVEGSFTAEWTVNGYSNVRINPTIDPVDDEVIYIRFDELAAYDTGEKPELNTTVSNALLSTGGTGLPLLDQLTDFNELDAAAPVFVAAVGDPVIDAWQVKLLFSEPVDISTGDGCINAVSDSDLTWSDTSGDGAGAVRVLADFVDADSCDSAGGGYYITPRLDNTLTHSDLGVDSVSLAVAYYDSADNQVQVVSRTVSYDQALELYYPMDAALGDNSSTLNDVSGKGRNGTVFGATLVRDMSDAAGQAYHFDGNDSIRAGNAYEGVTGVADRTFSAWVWSEHGYFNSSDHKRGVILSYGSSQSGKKFEVTVNHDSSRGQLGGLNLNTYDYYRTTDIPVIVGGWMHIAVVWDDDGTPTTSDNKLYINGRLAGDSGDNNSFSTTAGNTLRLGRDANSAQYYLHGKLDEVRLYSRALSAAEINKLAVKVPNGLVAHYTMDDNSGATGTVSDKTGNGLDAANNSATWTTDRYGNTYSAMNFSSQSVTRSTTDGLPLGNADRTVCYWLTTNSLPGSASSQIALSYGVNADGQEYSTGVGNGIGDDRIILSTHLSGVSTDAFYSNYTTALGQWQYHCITSSGTTDVRIYINGVEYALLTASVPGLNTSSGNFLIGDAVGGTRAWDGKLDDIRIYNRALSAGEVAALATELDRELVAYYPLDDAATTAVDYSKGNNNSVTAVNGTPLYRADRFGNPASAFEFDGGSMYLQRAATTGLPDLDKDRTVCTWSNLNGNQSLEYGLVTYGDATNYFAIRTRSTSVPAVSVASSNSVESTLAKPADRWFHICGVQNSGIQTLYVNGFAEATGALSVNTTSTELRIADKMGGGGNSEADGLIDDVRIYGRALSLTEIRALSGFYPSHIDDLAVWYDAGRIGDPSNADPADGSNLQYWYDLSGNQLDAKKTTGGAGSQPDWYAALIDGNPTVRFDGTNSMDLAKDAPAYDRDLSVTAHTQLALFRASGSAPGSITEQNGVFVYGYDSGPILKTGIGSSATSNTGYVDNLWVFGGFSYDNPAGSFYLDGAIDGTFNQAAVSSTGSWRLGDNLIGDIAELVLYDRVLSDDELYRLNCYFSKKYPTVFSMSNCD